MIRHTDTQIAHLVALALAAADCETETVAGRLALRTLAASLASASGTADREDLWRAVNWTARQIEKEIDGHIPAIEGDYDFPAAEAMRAIAAYAYSLVD